MTDPVSQIKSAVTTEADSLKGIARQFEEKQAAWTKGHLVALVIGAVLGFVTGWVIHGL